MNKRYQVFISSTFLDLSDERRNVMESVMQMDCIPSGMEMFPASSDEQFEFIKKVINDCDYYILVIGGRYGSVNLDGISYTEKEYDYALSKKIPILVFIHRNPDSIPFGKSEKDPDKLEKLNEFKNKVSKNRLVKYWEHKDELAGLVAFSLSNAIKMYPRSGWIRTDDAGIEELINQTDKLRSERESYIFTINELKDKLTNVLKFEKLSKGKDRCELEIYVEGESGTESIIDRCRLDEIFTMLGQYLFDAISSDEAKKKLGEALKTFPYHRKWYTNITIDENSFQKIKVQFIALKFISIFTRNNNNGESIEYIQLTEIGKEYLIKLQSIKKSDSKKIEADIEWEKNGWSRK